MTMRSRKIILSIFFFFFFVTAPAVVLYTAGYRYNWKKQKIEKTGIMLLTAKTPGAALFINGVRQKKDLPASLRLLPEDYLVRIEKPGYLPWIKTLEVRSGETTFADGIALVKDALPRLALRGDVAGAAMRSDGTMIAYLARGESWMELGIMRTADGSASLLARFSKDAYENAALSWSPDGGAVIFQADGSDGSGRVLFLYPEQLDPAAAMALHEKLPPLVAPAKWSADGKRLAVASDKGVYVINARNGAVIPFSFSPSMRDAAFLGRDVAAIRQEADGQPTVETLDEEGDSARIAILPPGAGWHFLDGTDDRLVIADDQKRTYVISPNGIVLGPFEGTAARWERPGAGRLLLCSDVEIGIVDPQEGDRALITRLGMPIIDCAWNQGGASVLYATATGIYAIELDDREERNVFDLVRFSDIDAFFTDPAGASLWFVGAAGNQRGIYERDL